MTPEIQAYLAKPLNTIDITSIGRKSGKPRRMEIWCHHVEGNIYITGLPGKRDWYANLVEHPDFTFHVKGEVEADLAATAVAIIEPEQKRPVLDVITTRIDRSEQLETWVTDSPLILVQFATTPND